MPFYSNTKCLSIHQSNHHLSQTNDSAHPNSNVLASALSVVITIIQSSSRISPLHRCVPATLLLDAMQSTSDMISPTRRFVLATDGKVVNQQMLCNGKSFKTGRHGGRGLLSSCCYSSRVVSRGCGSVKTIHPRIRPHLHPISPHSRVLPFHHLSDRCLYMIIIPHRPLNSTRALRSIRNCKPSFLHSAGCTPPLLPHICKPGSISSSLFQFGFTDTSHSAACKPARPASHEKEWEMQASNVLDLIQSFPLRLYVFTLHSLHTTASPSVLQATEMEGI